MKLNLVLMIVLSGAFACACDSYTLAETILASDLTDGDPTFTTTDGLVTLNPFTETGAAGLLGINPGCCIGVQGDNPVAIDEVGGVSERLDVVLDPSAHLSGVGIIFSRVIGPDPTNGIVFSGFQSDPLATVDAAAATAGVTVNYSGGSVFIFHNWRGGAVTEVTFANASASLGQTISISSDDVSDDGQTALNSISYTAVPEPAAATLIGLVIFGVASSRRRI